MATLSVNAHQIGTKKALLTNVALAIEDKTNWTLRDLIRAVVRAEVQAFDKRQADRMLLRVLTPADIALGREAGKIEMGDRAPQSVDEEAAIEAAIQAFVDGLYFVFIDDQQIEQIDQPILLHPDSRLKFIRLVALAGG
jgi:hypothetical protein